MSTTGVIDIQTKSGLFAPGGFVSMYGGGYNTLQPSAEYGGSFDGYNYYVSGDFLSTNHGIDGVTSAVTQIHDQSEQVHGFAYLDKIIDGENRVTAIAGLFNGRFLRRNPPSGDRVMASGAPRGDGRPRLSPQAEGIQKDYQSTPNAWIVWTIAIGLILTILAVYAVGHHEESKSPEQQRAELE